MAPMTLVDARDTREGRTYDLRADRVGYVVWCYGEHGPTRASWWRPFRGLAVAKLRREVGREILDGFVPLRLGSR